MTEWQIKLTRTDLLEVRLSVMRQEIEHLERRKRVLTSRQYEHYRQKQRTVAAIEEELKLRAGQLPLL